MSDLLHNWVDAILGLFSSHRPGEGMKYQAIEAKYGRTFGKESISLSFIIFWRMVC